MRLSRASATGPRQSPIRALLTFCGRNPFSMLQRVSDDRRRTSAERTWSNRSQDGFRLSVAALSMFKSITAQYTGCRIMQDEHTENRVGARLRRSIELRGESLAAFARATKIPYRSLQDYVGGQSKPGFDQLAKMAEGGLDIGFILTGFPTGSVDHPSPDRASFISLGGGSSLGAGYVLREHIEAIAPSADSGIDLRDWVQAWTQADDYCNELGVLASGLNRPARQAVVFAIAVNIVVGVKDRLRALGLISG